MRACGDLNGGERTFLSNITGLQRQEGRADRLLGIRIDHGRADKLSSSRIISRYLCQGALTNYMAE